MRPSPSVSAWGSTSAPSGTPSSSLSASLGSVPRPSSTVSKRPSPSVSTQALSSLPSQSSSIALPQTSGKTDPVIALQTTAPMRLQVKLPVAWQAPRPAVQGPPTLKPSSLVPSQLSSMPLQISAAGIPATAGQVAPPMPSQTMAAVLAQPP